MIWFNGKWSTRLDDKHHDDPGAISAASLSFAGGFHNDAGLAPRPSIYKHKIIFFDQLVAKRCAEAMSS